MKFAPNSVLLELHVPDFEVVKKFYGLLGFVIIWESLPEETEGYLVLKMGDNILSFWPGNESVNQQPYFSRFPKETKRGYGVEIVLMVDDIDQYYERVKDKVKVVEELVIQPWGRRDFRIEDPFGYYLRITSFHNILDNSNEIE